MRRSAAAVLAAWATLVAAGQAVLLEHSTAAGDPGHPPAVLPRELAEALRWDPMQPLLLLAAHPQCPCLPATLAELQRTLDGAAPPTLRVLVHTPSSPPPAWDSGADAELRRRLPAGVAIDDRDGALATKLGLRTSGHVLLFAADGRLRFTGGVTAGRGHEGDNRAGRTLAAMLGDAGKPQASTAVFGCPLQADSSPHDGPCCDHERPRLDPTAR
ncbi:MAG: hypothetical protein ACK501_20085 [Planctomycetota bacterium]